MPTRHPDDDTGRPTPEERHPRIVHVPHLHEGRAVIRGTRISVERVLRDLAREAPVPLALAGQIREADLQAALLYVCDVMRNLNGLYARLQPAAPEKKKA